MVLLNAVGTDDFDGPVNTLVGDGSLFVCGVGYSSKFARAGTKLYGLGMFLL